MSKSDIFKVKTKKIHGNKYDYCNVNYVNSYTKVCIICSEHGEFWKTPNNHLHGQGCPKCNGRNNSTESIIESFKKVHGNRYDYSKVEFKRVDKKVCILCPIHGEFWQDPRIHLNGSVCSYCAGKFMGTKEFIRRAKIIHGDKYDYSKVNYIDSKTKVCIICPKHGEFWQKPNNHLTKYGCRKCGSDIVHEKMCKDNRTFITEARSIHQNKYDYSKSEYYNIDTKVCIICPKHGEFWQTPYKHVQSHHGCPICRSSHLENEIRVFLIKNNIKFIEQYRVKWLNRQSLDFYLTDYKIGIECQGGQHFLDGKTFGGNNIYSKVLSLDKCKLKKCQENGVKLLYYSNLGIKYPYKVFEDKELLLNEIKSTNITENNSCNVAANT